MSSSDGPWDVVVLYSGVDAEVAKRIVAQLKAWRLRVWFAPTLPAGMDWKRSLLKALSVAPCAAVLCGSELGGWKLKEAGAALARTRVIPVLLPGLDRVPDELAVDLDSVTAVLLGTIDEKSLEALRDAIHDAIRDAHAQTYDIEIEVPKAAQSCVVVASSPAIVALCASVDQAIQQIRRAKGEAPTHVEMSSPPVTGRTVTAIRESELVIADCTSAGGQSAIRPAIAYQVGMAHALGKPTILITDQEAHLRAELQFPAEDEGRQMFPTVVIAERPPGEALDSLLRDSISNACKAVAPFLLVDQGIAGMRVLDRDLKCLRPRLWPEFNRLLSFDLDLLRNSEVLLRCSHELLDHVEEIARLTRDEWGSARNDVELRARRERMRTKYQPFSERLDVWEKWSREHLSGGKTELDSTFGCIEAHLPEDSQDALQKARARWGLVQDDSGAFTSHCCDLKTYAQTGFTCLNTLRETEDRLLSTMRAIHQSLSQVHNEAHNMMTTLLQVVLEGTEHVVHSAVA